MICTLWILAWFSLVAQQHALPKFEDYPVVVPEIKSPAPVDLSRRTVLRHGAKKGPNFAGRYTVVIWGCGAPCKSFSIVDAITGKVHEPGFSLTLGASFRIDSDLFIVDPPELWRESFGDLVPEAFGGNAQVEYYRWNGERLVLIDSLALGKSVGR